MARASGSKAIAAHARLLPVGGVAAGAGAIALGPLVGIVALTVGAEMLARQQLEQKLETIQRDVRDISQHLQQQLRASITTAEAALEDATTALLDHIEVPEGVGLGSAITDLRQVKNQALGWLERWEQVATGFAGTPGGTRSAELEQFRDELGSVAIGGWDALPANMVLLYRALALDSRAHIVSLAQATLDRPAGTFDQFEAQIGDRLAANAAAQERLANLLWALATTSINAGVANIRPRNWRQLGKTHTTITELTRALTAAPEAPAMVTSDNRLLIEATRAPDGRVELLQPLRSTALR
jgi:hypothetical protein